MNSVREMIKHGFGQGLLRRYALVSLAKLHLLRERFVYDWALVDRPHYAYGLMNAAIEAKILGKERLTAIEFGVAGGNGLLAMEKYAADISKMVEIEIQVIGFDSGTGLPAPSDYRDLPYLWSAGDFEMDVDDLKRRLISASLQLGPISETLPVFLSNFDNSAPIGFIAVDVDLWSSTQDCLRVFDAPLASRLPRVWCYFDDIVATIPDVGELLAIRGFNDTHEFVKIRQPFGLRAIIPLQPSWADQMWQAHSFKHPDYGKLLTSASTRQLPLRSD